VELKMEKNSTKDLVYEKADWNDLIDNNNEIDFLVKSKQFKKVLSEIGNKIDEDDFIIDAKTNLREIAKDEDEIRLKQLGGLLTGSKVFIKKNIASFSEHLIEKKK